MHTQPTTKTQRFLLARSMVSRAGGASIPQLMDKLGASRVTVWRMLSEIREDGTKLEEEEREGRTFFQVPQGQRGAQITLTESRRCLQRPHRVHGVSG
jgi:biotin operon repressor